MQRRVQDFSTEGARPKDRRAERRGGVPGEGSSNPFPPSMGSGERCELPSRVRDGARPPLFSALRMASPDTIILLIMDYHAAIGGQDPAPTALRTAMVSC